MQPICPPVAIIQIFWAAVVGGVVGFFIGLYLEKRNRG